MTHTAGGRAADNLAAESGPPRRRTAASVFWRYWSASTISSLGDGVTAVALPLAAVTLLRASAFDVGVLTATRYLGWVLIGLPAGVIVARLPLRATQIGMDLLRAAALLTIPAAAAAGLLTFAQLAAAAALVGLAGVVFDVGNATFLPSIVSREELTARNSLVSGAHAATQLTGPSLGGLLVQAFGPALSLLADIASYLGSAVLLRSLPRPAIPAPEAGSASVLALIRGGLGYVSRHPVMRPCVAAATAINFVCGALMALTPVFLVRALGAPAWLVGVAMAGEGLGSLAGAAACPWLASALGSARAVIAAAAVAAGAALLMPAAGPGWGVAAFAAGNAGFAAGVVVFSILTRTHRHAVTPPELLSRVMATVRFASWGAIPAGSLAAGAAAAALGSRDALWLTCLLAFAPPLVLAASRVRSLRDLADSGQA